jgi:hypothetical protein
VVKLPEDGFKNHSHHQKIGYRVAHTVLTATAKEFNKGAYTGLRKVLPMIKARAHKGGVRIGKTPKKLASICCP